MYRAAVSSKLCNNLLSIGSLAPRLSRNSTAVSAVHGSEESPEDLNKRFINYFNNPEIDGWFLRKGLTDLHREDAVPEPEVLCSALRACRRVNDFALAIRCLEAARVKCGDQIDKIFPYLIQECKPTMDELGIPTLEEIGYDKPEFHVPEPSYYWTKEYQKMYNVKERNIMYEPGVHYY